MRRDGFFDRPVDPAAFERTGFYIADEKRRRRGGSSLKLLIVAHRFWPQSASGSGIYAHGLARGLQKAGVEVAVAYAAHRPGIPSYTVTRTRCQGVPGFEVANNRLHGALEQDHSDPAMEVVFETLLAQYEPDAVIFQHLKNWSLGLPSLCREASVPSVLALHDNWLICPQGGLFWRPEEGPCDGAGSADCARCVAERPPYPVGLEIAMHRWLGRIGPPFGPLVGRLALTARRRWPIMGPLADRFLGFTARGDKVQPPIHTLARRIESRRREARRAASQADAWVSPTQFTADLAGRRLGVKPQRLYVAGCGIDPAPFAKPRPPRAQSGPVRFGYLGPVAPQKGVRELVEAFAGVPATKATLEIAGDATRHPAYVREIKKMAGRAARAEGCSISFLGPQSRRWTAALLRSWDVLVAPSLWYECSPLEVYEAFLSGTAVLASDRGALAEIVGRNGVLTEAGEVRALRRAIVSLADNRSRVQRLGQNLSHVRTPKDDASLYIGVVRKLVK